MVTQKEIAAHLDMTERNLRDVLIKLKLDHRTASVDQIRVAYIRYMRNVAAGRGGDEQESLVKARTREAQINAQAKELQYFRDVGTLVAVDEIEPVLANWAVLARSEVKNAVEKIIAGIESKHSIEVDQEIIDESLGAAYSAIASYPTNAASNAEPGGEEMGTATQSLDTGVAEAGISIT